MEEKATDEKIAKAASEAMQEPPRRLAERIGRLQLALWDLNDVLAAYGDLDPARLEQFHMTGALIGVVLERIRSQALMRAEDDRAAEMQRRLQADQTRRAIDAAGLSEGTAREQGAV